MQGADRYPCIDKAMEMCQQVKRTAYKLEKTDEHNFKLFILIIDFAKIEHMLAVKGGPGCGYSSP